MDIPSYLNAKREFQDNFLLYIDNENNDERNLADSINEQNIHGNVEELKVFFNFICNIINNHYRNTNFFNKIERIFLLFSEDIKNIFTNTEIYSYFKNNNRFLIFLIKHQIISIDESIITLIYENNPGNKYLYFATELKTFFDDKTNESIYKEMTKYNLTDLSNFEEKRRIGENCSLICQLIRQDSIEDFIIYVNKNNISLSSNISSSIYETNPFLIKNKRTSLIEYAAFFGSIQIFQFLRLNNIELNSSLWLYAIHGRNPEIIHLLEENKVIPNDKSFDECLKMAIMCHHNDVALYIYDNLFNQNDINLDFNMNFHSYCFLYANFAFFPNDICFKYYFNYLCKYNYLTLVELFLKLKGFDFQNELVLFNVLMNISPLFLAANANNDKILNLLLSQLASEISDKCFKECRYLKHISIPSSIKSIGNECFYNCSSLISITIPSSVTSIGNKSFYGCSVLKQISIPSSVTSIGSECFGDCSSLIEITIPSSLSSIGDGVFNLCISLQSISIPSSLTSIKNSFFKQCNSLARIKIPSSIASIEDKAFFGCRILKEIIIPSSVTSIGKYSFGECESLIRVIIPSSITIIKNNAFSACSSLTQINLPSSLNSIEDETFEYCVSLKQITIPSSITKIGEKAFGNCSSLEQIIIPSSVTELGKRAFEKCSTLKQILIPPSIKSIEFYCFYYCTSLEKVSIPDSVTSIGKYAFAFCTSLKEISIPSSVTLIDDFSFYECKNLTHVSMPSEINYVGHHAFRNCLFENDSIVNNKQNYSISFRYCIIS